MIILKVNFTITRHIRFFYFIIFELFTLLSLTLSFGNNIDNTKSSSNSTYIDVIIYDKVANSIFFDNVENYLEFTSRNDITFMSYYYSKNHTQSKAGALLLYRLENKLDFLGKIAFINCDNVNDRHLFNSCNIKTKEGDYIFPRMKINIPPNVKYNKKTKEVFNYKEVAFQSKEVSRESLLNSFITNLNSHIVLIDNKTKLEEFIKIPLIDKALIFLDETLINNKEFNYNLVGLSNIFYDRIMIANVTDKNIAKYYEIEEFPSILIIQNNFFKQDKPKTIKINKSTNSFDQYYINNILKKYAFNEKIYLRRMFEDSLENIKVFDINEKKYQTFMEKFKDYSKIIFFTYGNNLTHDMEKFVSKSKYDLILLLLLIKQ